ncbi:unnamed protein product [Caenorhabditis angaria]|uniref:Uncharacterized protein n=1 Tax=Caenorhabditis angaria TaxID=860376 RepID=A0A9P1N484_9PELO|nr:unnamed protein product [Caenorhabditis angaria]
MTRESLAYRIGIVFYFIFGYLFIVLFSDLPRILFRSKKNIAGQIVVITGGAMGIGKQLAKKLCLEQNAKVVILDVNEAEGLKTEEEIVDLGGVAKFYKCDVSSDKQLEDVRSRIEADENFGVVDIVIANAAILKFGSVTELTNDDYILNSKVNYLGHIFTIKTFLGKMIEAKKGHIVSIGSICGHFGEASGSAYCSSKFAARGFLESLQAEIFDLELEKNIILTSIYPYFVNTPFLKNLQEPHSTFWDVIPPEVVANEITDSILYNRHSHFIPGSIKILCVYMKWMCTFGTIPIGRKVFNVSTKPKFLTEKTL